MSPSKKKSNDFTKQTINTLTVLLYNSRLCSHNYILNLINSINFYVTFIAIYVYYVSSIPSYREEHNRKYVITEYLVTAYYMLEILIRYILYTFYDITTYGRIDEIYAEKSSVLNLSERQYRIITVGQGQSKNDINKVKKKEKSLAHFIRFFINKIEIVCLLNIMPLFAIIIINKSVNEIYNDSKLSIIVSVFQYTRIIRFLYYIYNSRLSKIFKMDLLVEVFKNAKEGLISTFLLSMWAIIFFSNFFFFAETYECTYDAQTDKLVRYNKDNIKEECRVQSIFDAYWWAVVTIQCIGYGDLTPATAVGKTVNGCIVLVANMIFSIPSAILTIEFLDLILQKKKNDAIEKAVIKCESKIDKARKRNFKKELMNIISSENIQNNANTFIKYYNIHDSIFGSMGSLGKKKSENQTNIIDLFKLKRSNNSLGYTIDRYHNSNNSINSNESLNKIKPGSYQEYQIHSKNNSLNENNKPLKSNSLNDSNIHTPQNDKILKSSEILLNDATSTIKYGIGDKLLNKKSNPDILKLNNIIKNQQYLNKITTQTNNYAKPFGMEGNSSIDSYTSTDSTVGKNRKNAKGEIEVEFKVGNVKYMTTSEISKEIYKLSMEYYAQCDEEFSEVDEQSGTLYLLMKGFERTAYTLRKLRNKRS